MYLYELLLFLKKKVGEGIHVVSSDNLPTVFKRPAGIIVNLSDSSSSGTHWVAIVIDELGNGTYFCSFGYKPKVRNIQRFLKTNCKTVLCNSQQLQKLSSTYCGEYCAVFLFLSLKHGLSLDHFLKYFSHNLVLNDVLIKKLFQRLDNFPN